MAEITIQQLLDTGAHFGHLTRKWNPKMEPYIFMEKNSIHLIDLHKTIEAINDAANVVSKTVSEGGIVLFVGTKKQAKDLIRSEATRCGMFYIVERWLGGTLTNFSTIRKSIKKLVRFEEEGTNLYEGLTKKEVLMLERERKKLEATFSGIKSMKKLPDLMVVVDSKHETIAVKEATKLDIPVIGIVDTDCDPTYIDYVIPANDDSLRTISVIISNLADAVLESMSKRRDLIEAESGETEVQG